MESLTRQGRQSGRFNEGNAKSSRDVKQCSRIIF